MTRDTPQEVSRYDEKVPAEFGFGQSLFDFYNKPLDERLFNAQREAVRRVAEKGRCVIVGRNANIILQEFDRTLHVFVAASLRFRIRILQERMPGVSEDRILEDIHTVDRARKKYCKHYTNTEFGNADYYDLCVKSSSLGIEKCIDMICDAADA